MTIQNIGTSARNSLGPSARAHSCRGQGMLAVLAATIAVALAAPVIAVAQTAAPPPLRIEHLRPGVAVLFGPGPTGGGKITLGYRPGKAVIVAETVRPFRKRGFTPLQYL